MTVQALEQKIEDLAAQLGRLQERVDELSQGMVRMATEVTAGEDDAQVAELAAQVGKLQARVEELSGGMVRMVTDVTAEERAEQEDEAGQGGKSADDLALWAGASSLLPRISTLCFLLVIALALRTVTDSGIINKHAGSIVGMVYAAALMGIGWLRYRRGGILAPVFSLSGALLMFSVVVETHTRFGSLPTAPAYALLIATGVLMAYTGRIAGSNVPTGVGTFGMSLAGLALNFPVASLPSLAVLLLAANLIAYSTSRLVWKDWLRWSIFFMTAVIVQIWGVRLGVALTAGGGSAAALGKTWFIPAAAAFAIFFFASTLRAMLHSAEGGRRFFDYVIPTASAFVFFTAARHVALPLWQNGLVIGGAGLAGASAHLAAASWMVKGRKLTAVEFNSFVSAAVVLLVLSLSAATGAFVVALPLLSAAAFHLAVISDRWQSGGTRAISYTFQVFVALALAFSLLTGGPAVPRVLAFFSAGTVAVCALLHYRYCRRKAPAADSIIFSRFDSGDYSGATLLLASLVGWFFLLRVIVYGILQRTAAGADVANAFSGAQSLVINGAAIVFYFLAHRRGNRELRSIALLVTLVGAAKVFFLDLVTLEGLARVFSVFSFGIVAAVASWVLGRWKGGPVVEPAGSTES